MTPRNGRRPRFTKDYATAAQRLADAMGFTMESTGRAWILTTTAGEYPPMSAVRVLGHLVGLATGCGPYDEETETQGPPLMSYAEAARICRFRRDVAAEHWWTVEIVKMLNHSEGGAS